MNYGHVNGRRVVDFTEQLHLKNAPIASSPGARLSELPKPEGHTFPPQFSGNLFCHHGAMGNAQFHLYGPLYLTLSSFFKSPYLYTFI